MNTEYSDPIVLSNVGKEIKGRKLVADLTFTVPAGVLFGLIGPSGGGKTTLVRLMLGILVPTRGEVRLLGSDPTRLSLAQRQRIGYMPQHFFLHPTLTARENLEHVAGLYGIGWWRQRSVVPGVLREMELWEARDRLAKDLSGGMLRRLQLAAVLMHRPRLVFVDEPMAGLDPILRQRMWEILRRLRDEGSTVILTTQITQEAERCDTLALVKDGRLVAGGAPDELRRRAMGGETYVMLVEEQQHEAMSALWATPGVIEVSPVRHRAIRVVADPERTGPDVLARAVRRRGVNVQAVDQAFPSFDEIFERLVRGA